MQKTAIITGGSRGIGRAVAKRLARDGFSVIVNYASNPSQAEAAVTEIKSAGGEAIALNADVANPADVERLFEETLKKFGSVDVVVNNAGIMQLSPIDKGDVELFDRVVSTNLRGTFFFTQAVARHIAASESSLPRSIVTVSSVSGEMASMNRWRSLTRGNVAPTLTRRSGSG